MSGLSLVLYLSGTALAQVRGGGHAPEATHRADPDDTHGKADAKEDAKQGDFVTRIQRNTELNEKINGLLKATGWTTGLSNAAMGFRNQGQFLAGLNAANDLGVTFAQFRMTMMSKNPPLSLGQTIHQLKPNLTEKEVDKAEDKAEKEAKLDEKTKPTTKPTT